MRMPCTSPVSVSLPLTAPFPNSPLPRFQIRSASNHRFTFDHVFGGQGGRDPSQLYSECVHPLVLGLFKGYNGKRERNHISALTSHSLTRVQPYLHIPHGRLYTYFAHARSDGARLRADGVGQVLYDGQRLPGGRAAPWHHPFGRADAVPADGRDTGHVSLHGQARGVRCKAFSLDSVAVGTKCKSDRNHPGDWIKLTFALSLSASLLSNPIRPL